LSILDIVGIEDGGFVAFKPNQRTLLCAVEMIGDFVKTIKTGWVKVDGMDVTDTIINMLVNIRCDALILGGVSFAGFNIVDVARVQRNLGMPVIVYSGNMPDSASVLSALKAHFEDWEDRWILIEQLGEIYSVVTKPGSPIVFYEVVGGSSDWADRVLKESAKLTRIPEPVRVAGLIARGLTRSV
jgi:endonuclease V-like protein UPF0215 family